MDTSAFVVKPLRRVDVGLQRRRWSHWGRTTAPRITPSTTTLATRSTSQSVDQLLHRLTLWCYSFAKLLIQSRFTWSHLLGWPSIAVPDCMLVFLLQHLRVTMTVNACRWPAAAFYYSWTVVHIHAADIASKHLSEHRICTLLAAPMQAFTVIVLWAHICVSRMSWTIQPVATIGKAFSNI